MVLQPVYIRVLRSTGLTALREYQKNIRIHKPGRDEMVLMNTWGDRGQDTRVGKNLRLQSWKQAKAWE